MANAAAVDELRKSYPTGQTIIYKGYTSVLADPAVAAAFQQSSGCGVLFVITVVNARSLTRYSQFKTEAELLLSPGAAFICTGATSISPSAM